MDFLRKFKQVDNGFLTLEGFLVLKNFTSQIPFYYTGHGLSVRVDGTEATIRDTEEMALLYRGSKQAVMQELQILLDKDNKD